MLSDGHFHELVDHLEYRSCIFLTAEYPLLVLHVELSYVRIMEILLVALQVFLAHLIGVYEMSLGVFNIDVFIKICQKISVVLVLYRSGLPKIA